MQTAILIAPQTRVERKIEINYEILDEIVKSKTAENRFIALLAARKAHFAYKAPQHFVYTQPSEKSRIEYALLTYNTTHSTLRDELRLEAKRWFFE